MGASFSGFVAVYEASYQEMQSPAVETTWSYEQGFVLNIEMKYFSWCSINSFCCLKCHKEGFLHYIIAIFFRRTSRLILLESKQHFYNIHKEKDIRQHQEENPLYCSFIWTLNFFTHVCKVISSLKIYFIS